MANSLPPAAVASVHTDSHPTPPVYAGWYSGSDVPSPWSTDWPNWRGLTLFHESIDGTLKVDKLFKEVYHVLGAIEPVAYMAGTGSDLYFFFFASGRYYFYDCGDLYFLAETLPPDAPMPSAQVEKRSGASLNFLTQWEVNYGPGGLTFTEGDGGLFFKR
ncbi:hypothetical protein C8F04DRAFT_1193178 [Mycena alexandri]|uniref:Uncharacterized protein n=1 Tax=Mycena alexandri TaxID=1745969 RepID=A0AAD6SA77_9AGAR|nr:hypothetical protein C8F04DRAFT_1193178 [Mycena alexandri]